SSLTHYAVVLCDNIGMLGIRDKFNSKNKINHEVIRYDEIASYEYYKEMNKPTQEGGKETFKEDGVILHLIQPFGVNDDMVKKGLRVHPYIKQDIKLCFRTRENGANYADNVIQHLDGVFGKNSHSKPLFGMSVADKRELQANVDMAKLMGGMIKSAVKGEADPNDPDLQTKFAKAQESADDAKTGGMAIYSRRADEAENSVTG
ncbi:MAG: hypothetical protein Q4A05_11630, partial [Ruminococcus sp.]|nr:hypothetical protein [Ruminococcus sp.]